MRPKIGEAIVATFSELDHHALGISVSGMHSQIVVELPDDVRMIKAIIGEAKRVSSRAVKSQMPGQIWAAGGDFDPVDTKRHLKAVLNYVLTKQGPTAWTWSFRQPVPRVRVEVRTPKVNRARSTRGGARPPDGGPRSAPA